LKKITIFVILKQDKQMGKLFKRMWLIIYLKLVRITKSSMSLIDENEIKSSAICRKLMSHPDSKFMIAPLSQKRYVKNDTLGMFIVLSNSRINITNHVYNYDVSLTQVVFDKLNKTFDNKVESLRLSFETEMRSQIKHSLTTILEKLI
jgi:competence CoiA-like predicted nuclease